LLDAGFTSAEAGSVKVFVGKGCSVCNKTGYKGRVGLYEVMEINDELRELILVGASALEIKKKAIDQGMIMLRRSGLIKIAAGLTTLEEVLRETQDLVVAAIFLDDIDDMLDRRGLSVPAPAPRRVGRRVAACPVRPG